MRLKRISQEVSIADEEIVRIGHADVAELAQAASASPLGRSRICAHKEATDSLHEMIIALHRGCYIRPHKHFGKSESFHIVQGEVDVIVFDDDGEICNVVELGEFASGRHFYYRLADPLFHTLLIRSEQVVLHETTNGPFKKEDAVFAPWSPDESDSRAIEVFMRQLAERVAPHLKEAHG